MRTKRKNFGKASHKNHVERVAPGTLSAMHKMFGISADDFMNAVYGDQDRYIDCFHGMSEKRFGNELQELKQKYEYDSTNEDTRHLYQTSLIDMRGKVGELMAVTRYQTDVMKEQVKIPMAEHKAEMDYTNSVNKMLWLEGSDARIDLIPKPNYADNVKGFSKLWKGFRNAVGI